MASWIYSIMKALPLWGRTKTTGFARSVVETVEKLIR